MACIDHGLETVVWCVARRIGYAMIDEAEKAGKITAGKVTEHRRFLSLWQNPLGFALNKNNVVVLASLRRASSYL